MGLAPLFVKDAERLVTQLTMISKLLKYSVATASSSKFSGFPQTGHTRCIIFLSLIVMVMYCETHS